MVVLQNGSVVKGRPVSPLRQRMIDDLNLGGYASGTMKVYINSVVRIGKYAGVRPDKLTEEEVRDYLIHMREVERVAKGTFQSNLYGLKFFYCNTLNYDWPLFTKKKWGNPVRRSYRYLFRELIALGL